MKSAAAPRLAIVFLGIAVLPHRLASGATFTVTVAPGGSLTFSPASQTVNVGDTVTWVWGLGTHSTTSGSLCLADDRWNSALQSDPFTFSVTFSAAGTYSYFCELHCGLGMTGEIVVKEPAATPTPTPTTANALTATPSALPATATPLGPGAVPVLSPGALGLFALALAGAALLLIERA